MKWPSGEIFGELMDLRLRASGMVGECLVCAAAEWQRNTAMARTAGRIGGFMWVEPPRKVERVECNCKNRKARAESSWQRCGRERASSYVGGIREWGYPWGGRATV